MHSNQQALSNSFNYKHNQNTFNQQSSITNKSNQFHNQLTTHNRLSYFYLINSNKDPHDQCKHIVLTKKCTFLNCVSAQLCKQVMPNLQNKSQLFIK